MEGQAVEITPAGMRKRVQRLRELAGKMEAEWAFASMWGEPLTLGEQQGYAKGIREAAEGLQRAGLVLADALERIAHGLG